MMFHNCPNCGARMRDGESCLKCPHTDYEWCECDTCEIDRIEMEQYDAIHEDEE